MNRIQFQSGLSLLEFMRSFGTGGAHCEQALRLARRPEGFACPHYALPPPMLSATVHASCSSAGRAVIKPR